MKKEKYLALLFIILSIFITGCGSKNKNSLKGKWQREDNFYGTVNLEFDDKEKVNFSYVTKTGEFNQDGTYKIEDDVIIINLKLWDREKSYTFEIKNNKLKLKDNSPLASALGGEYTRK